MYICYVIEIILIITYTHGLTERGVNNERDKARERERKRERWKERENIEEREDKERVRVI